MAESITPYQLGLFGHPVKHSQSPRIHAEFAKQFDIQLNYQLIDANATQLPNEFKQWIKTAHGCNVTVPHKNNIIPLLDHYTERAHLTQAVNTVYWQDGELWGDNTDGDGLVLDLKHKNVTLKDTQVLIIGAGGTTQGIIPSLLNQGVKQINITNRDVSKAEKLAAQYARCVAMDKDNASGYDLIIHATSMGHQGQSPELKSHWLHNETTVYDLSYGSAAEAFLTTAKALGVKHAYDGLGMLYGQAALAFE
ncbi:Shikimate 5-dehydrogenase I alpha, partial [hydrothermal vent metagenome]